MSADPIDHEEHAALVVGEAAVLIGFADQARIGSDGGSPASSNSHD
jgi:hypothetical protein